MNKFLRYLVTNKIWLVIFGIMALTIAPLIYGWLKAPAGYAFTGIRFIVPGDMSVYFSYLEQIRQGNYLLADIFTPEAGAKSLNIFWLVVGLSFRFLPLSLLTVFIFWRIILGVVLLRLVYELTSYFSERGDKLVRFLFVIFASGLGFGYSIFFSPNNFKLTPMDTWVPELNIILSLLNSPHQIASTLFLLSSLWFGFKAINKNSLPAAIWSGCCGLVLFQFHPFFVPVVYGVIGVYYLIQIWKNPSALVRYFGYGLTIFLISLPSVIYHGYLLATDWIFLTRATHNILLLPQFHLWLLSYGLLLPLALLGFWRRVKTGSSDHKNVFLLTWFVVQGVIMFLPFTFQRRLVEGWNIPLAILAWEGAFWLFSRYWLRLRQSSLFLGIFFYAGSFLLFSSSFYALTRDYFRYHQPNSYKAFIFYISPERQAGYEWLKNNLTENDIIFTYVFSGNFIPGQSGRRVYFGHYPESILAVEEKDPLTNEFLFGHPPDSWRQSFFRRNKITYLWWSDTEREVSDYNPEQATWLKNVYTNSEVTIYQAQW